MKICILSMQKINNFGSLLQAYSLKKILEEMGHSVKFIDIEKNEADNQLLHGQKNQFLKEREGNNGFFSKIAKIDKYTWNRMYIKKKNEEQNQAFNTFREQFLKIKKSDNEDNYDVCIIGSDEVFNCLANSEWGFTSQLFGNVRQANNVITYAASCGATKYEKLPVEVQEKIRETFKNMTAFSVRDENTKEFVKKLTHQEVSLNLDPVIIGDFDEEIKKYAVNVKLPKHYCIVYSYYNRMHDKNEIKTIQEFCKKRKLELVTIGAPQMWIHNHLVLNPFEMLLAFSKADFVITDTFHGTILASKYSSKFATIVRESNQNKLSDLMTRLGVEKHLMKNKNDIDSIFEIVNDINKNKALSLEQLQISKDYLNKNL